MKASFYIWNTKTDKNFDTNENDFIHLLGG